jgi:cellulose synthase/poly-beta-1,6-N-acetylglucosamine synthase-like glycosyltransferase
MSNFNSALDLAKKELGKKYFKANPQYIYDLLNYKNESERADVETFFRSSFMELKKFALANDGLVNAVTFDALARAIGLLGNSNLAPLLGDEFSYAWDPKGKEKDGIDRHYELIQTTGTIAISLSWLGYQGDQTPVDNFLKWCSGRYEGKDFTMKVWYLKWLAANAGNEALEFLKTKNEGRNIAACALADLDFKPAKDTIKELIPSLKNPIAVEVFKEAANRLATQTQIPKREQRMIHLFGRMTSTEKVLGKETDNEFAIRAQKKTKDSETGLAFETEDSEND